MKRYMCILLVFCMILLSGCELTDIEELEKILFPNRIDYDAYVHINDLNQLRDYVSEQRAQDNLQMSFVYTGEDELTCDSIIQFVDVCYVELVVEGENYCLHHLTLTEYPGNRIVDAYFKDDTSQLSADEIQALNVAVKIVEEAKMQAETNLELEIALYDALIEHITYVRSEVEFDAPENQPRPLNAVGALVDGMANCQGYTDAFYTVASIAGFEVGRMGVETPEDPHMVNTVFLDGKWYVVDVTFGDDDQHMIEYRLLNAGKDMIVEYWWDESNEIYPISETTNPEYYYYQLHQAAFDTKEEVLNYFAEQWKANGYGVYCAVHFNGFSEDYDAETANDELYDILSQLNQALQYKMWFLPNERDVYYTVEFSEAS